jgi:nicotinate phosphoribosyltransferase
MLNAAIYGYKMANEMAMKNWVKVYDGDLGIALPDTYTTSEFLKTFSLMEAKLFDGVRHDSGDPFEFVDKVVEFYKAKKII